MGVSALEDPRVGLLESDAHDVRRRDEAAKVLADRSTLSGYRSLT